VKRLYLIRHAKSSKDLVSIKDRDRPLNERGETEVRYMGKRLKMRGITVEAIYSSPAKRALDTAKAIAKKIGYPKKSIKIKEALYYSNIPKLMRIIKRIDDKIDSAMIFGHNPEFLNLINYLVTRKIAEFPTCSIFFICFNVNSWAKIAKKKGKIIFFERAKR
jgi:phosphohistidine phosphatase